MRRPVGLTVLLAAACAACVSATSTGPETGPGPTPAARGGTFEVVVSGLEAPADIGYDTARGRLLVPLFNAGEVRVYDVARR